MREIAPALRRQPPADSAPKPAQPPRGAGGVPGSVPAGTAARRSPRAGATAEMDTRLLRARDISCIYQGREATAPRPSKMPARGVKRFRWARAALTLLPARGVSGRGQSS